MALDPGLTVQLLDIAFTASGSNPRKFVALADVLGNLGYSTIRTIAVHSAVGHVFAQESEPGAFDATQHWRKALRGAYLAQLLARGIGYANLQEAYFSGLPRDVGQLVMLT